VTENEVPSAPKLLTIDAILAAPDVGEELFPVPEWDGSVKLRGLTKRQQAMAVSQATINGRVDTDVVQLLVFIAGVVEPKFGPEHMGQLQEKAYGVIERVTQRIMTLSGMSDTFLQELANRFQK